MELVNNLYRVYLILFPFLMTLALFCAFILLEKNNGGEK
jgi:hypothetical protein